VKADGIIDGKTAREALDAFEVDHKGFDQMDRRLLLTLIEKFNGGPAGVESLSAAIGEEKMTIEDVFEPYLIQEGYLQRTARGRIACAKAYEHFGLKATTQKDLF
jgi:Holliday junction DNA helicase RuvB